MDQAVCVVAGVGPGLGMAVARRFAREGFDVALLARSEHRLRLHVKELAGQTERADQRVLGHAVDLADPVALQRAMATITETLGAPTVLVYNAAQWHQMPALQVTPAEFSVQLGVSVVGALTCVQCVATGMRAAGGGSVLFTGGGLALYPQYGVGVSTLSAGKSALRALGYALHGELADDGIHVATVTVAGTVAPDTPFDPDRIAEHYWTLHRQPRIAWQPELVFDGKG